VNPIDGQTYPIGTWLRYNGSHAKGSNPTKIELLSPWTVGTAMPHAKVISKGSYYHRGEERRNWTPIGRKWDIISSPVVQSNPLGQPVQPQVGPAAVPNQPPPKFKVGDLVKRGASILEITGNIQWDKYVSRWRYDAVYMMGGNGTMFYEDEVVLHAPGYNSRGNAKSQAKFKKGDRVMLGSGGATKTGTITHAEPPHGPNDWSYDVLWDSGVETVVPEVNLYIHYSNRVDRTDAALVKPKPQSEHDQMVAFFFETRSKHDGSWGKS